jgi:hypothetical protein
MTVSEGEAMRRTRDLLDDGQRLLALTYTGGETEHAHIYLATFTGYHNGNEMLWINYIWLSKPDAYDSDMVGENGISIRLSDGMTDNLRQQMIHSLAMLSESGPSESAYYER